MDTRRTSQIVEPAEIHESRCRVLLARSAVDKGNQVRAPGRQVAYTSFDLPKTMDGPSGRTVFGYDGFGARVLKRSPEGTVITLGGLYERRVEGDLPGFFGPVNSRGQDRSVAQVVWSEAGGTVTAEDTSYLHDDHLGSLDTVGAGNATVRARFRRDPFGTPVASDRPPEIATGSDPLFRLGFTGQIEDRDLGLVDMRGRIYDPRTSTFLTPDPIVSDPAFGPAFNRYAYVLNNPVNLVDPTGFATTGQSGGSSSAQAGLAPGISQGGPSAADKAAANAERARDPSLERFKERKGVITGWGIGSDGNSHYFTQLTADDNGTGAATPPSNANPASQWSGGTGPTSGGGQPQPQSGSTWAGPNAGDAPSDRVIACLACVIGEGNYGELAKEVDSGRMTQGDLAIRAGTAVAVALGIIYVPAWLGTLTLRAPQLVTAGAAFGTGAGAVSQLVTSPTGARHVQNSAKVLSQLFGKGVPGARAVLTEIRFFGGQLIPPPGLTQQTLIQYRDVARNAIAAGKDTLGVQAMRLQIIDAALKLPFPQ